MDLFQSLGNILNPNKNMSDIKNISCFEKLQSLSKDTIIHLLLCAIDNSNKMEQAMHSAINDDNLDAIHAILVNGNAIAYHDDICCIVNENLSSEDIVSKFDNLGIVPKFEETTYLLLGELPCKLYDELDFNSFLKEVIKRYSNSDINTLALDNKCSFTDVIEATRGYFDTKIISKEEYDLLNNAIKELPCNKPINNLQNLQ